jgi:hypothetical protein
MHFARPLCSLALSSVVALLAAGAVGCATDTGQSSDAVTDVPHTPVERQAIGNCWLYAQASWVESMNLARTGVAFDVSQSYWTYWHWFDQLTSGWSSDKEISTGGNQYESNEIIVKRGIMAEIDFVPEDATSEMSSRQSTALSRINTELSTGRLKSSESRNDFVLVRQVMDDAWGLTPEVRTQLDQVFGADGQNSFDNGAVATGTKVIDPETFQVRYAERDTDPDVATVKDTNILVAIDEWSVANYPTYGGSLETQRRSFQIRVQRALHDRQPVVITWDVDFNAMEGTDPALRGSFNLTTLERAGGPGRQGGHMTVLEDYEVTTEQYGELKAGVTLDPSNPDDAAKLEAALLPSSVVKFFRIKNSWGAFRDDRSSAPGFPGYHDLYMDYMNGPIKFCPSVEGTKTAENCTGTTIPLNDVMLPPGY